MCAAPITVTIDSHFHANINHLPAAQRRAKAKRFAPAVAHLDILCSTEHAYRNPLEAYDFLCEAAAASGSKTKIVAGVENISSEGVEVIFLAKDRASLIKLIAAFPPFDWSIHNSDQAAEHECITILPHAFSPSTTGIVNNIGIEKALPLLSAYDFIEANNGGFYGLDPKRLPAKGLRDNIVNTANFPKSLLDDGVKYSVGSDAHNMRDLNIFGVAATSSNSDDPYSMVKHSETMQLMTNDAFRRKAGPKVVESLIWSVAENLQKRVVKRLR